ncbi:hypothetical protein FB451DRAFT_1532784 [Mycena latifolia]|nr:hypothetical protein FB451DRAFT_1532784 [Mycena latifolia]
MYPRTGKELSTSEYILSSFSVQTHSILSCPRAACAIMGSARFRSPLRAHPPAEHLPRIEDLLASLLGAAAGLRAPCSRRGACFSIQPSALFVPPMRPIAGGMSLMYVSLSSIMPVPSSGTFFTLRRRISSHHLVSLWHAHSATLSPPLRLLFRLFRSLYSSRCSECLSCFTSPSSITFLALFILG